MSLGRSSRFRSLGIAKVKSEKVLSSFASASSIITHHGSMMFSRILGMDVGKTLMNMEMLKFLKARSDTKLYLRYQSEYALHLPNFSITIVSIPI